MRILAFVLVLTGLAGCTHLGPQALGGDDGWRLIYAAGADGRAIAGDKQALARAVRAGLPVRVGWGLRWEGRDGFPGGIEHVADAGFVSLYKGEVFAQVSGYLRQQPAADRAEIALTTDGGRFVAMLDTTGRLQHRFQPGGGAEEERVATFWYVPWRSARGPAGVDVPERLN